MTAVANLIIPRYVIRIYGSEVNGLTSSIAHVLSIVNLIQAGLGSSVTYLMYKPIGEKNRQELGNIIFSAQRIYRYISLIVMILGTAASVIFAFFVKTDLRRDMILIASILTCIDSAASTYFTAVGNIFLSAKQDGYLLSRVSILSNLIGYVLRAFTLILRLPYILLYIINLLVSIINMVGIAHCFKKQYEPFRLDDEEKKQLRRIPIPGVSYAAANEVAHSGVGGSVTIIISMIAGLKAASVFSVYMIAISVLSTVSNAIYSAVVPSYGSVAAEEDMEKTNRIFEIYQFVLFTLNAWMFMCAAYLMVPFVMLYTKGSTDVNYLNNPLMILMVLYGIFGMTRIPYNNTVYIRGLFKETFLQPVICAVIAIILMIVFSYIDYTYALLGLIFFFGANTFYQHFKLPKIYTGFRNGHFFRHFSVLIIGTGLAILAYFKFPVYPESFLTWGLTAVATGGVAFIVVSVLVLLIDRSSFRLSAEYFLSRFRNRKKK